MTGPLVEARGLAVAYGAHPVLSGVDVAIHPGEIVTIVGPNGSGKSSLLRALLGTLPPRRGHVARKPGLRIGYVPQKLVIDRSLPMTLARFLALPRAQPPARISAALAEAGAETLASRQIRDLSGGQMQRALLARALIDRPELLLLDEPTQGLDQSGSAAFYRRIAELRATLDCAVVMVSHDLHVVMAASDRVICVNGHICCQGAPDVVASAPEYRALFGTGTAGALALYRHAHDHTHDPGEGDRSRPAGEGRGAC